MSFDNQHVQATIGLRYGSIRMIGEGGMAAVFGAYDSVLKRTVAIKLVSEAHDSGELAMRFQREAKAASRLNHPNIVKVLDFGVGQNGTLYLIMDLVEGSSLQHLLDQSGYIGADMAISMFIQICDALGHAHHKAVVHRDLKPSNIMLVADEGKHSNVRIVDFGIAKVMSGDQKITSTGQMLGTPLYVSPEQIQTKAVDHRTDIYSFGCVMMATLTGSPPFRGDSAFDTCDMHLNTPAPTLADRGYDQEHGLELNRIMAKSLEKDPGERYSSFREVKVDLMQLLPEESRSAIYEAEEKYAKDQYAALPFVSQHKVRLIVLGLLVTILGAFGFYRVEHKKPAIVTQPDKFNYTGVEESNWNFFCHNKGGLPTWTNIDCRMSDKHFKLLVGKGVRSVSLYAMRLNGSGLKYLINEPIEHLSVAESKIVDENLHYVGDLKTLNSLDISYTWITDSGVESITELPRLKSLGMAGCTKLTANSIDAVSRFAPNLVSLNISLTPVGIEGFKKLQQLKKLRNLNIALSELTDHTVVPVFALQNLEQLTISKNKKLTDVTLNSLKKLRKLNQLKIEECSGFSTKAIENFKEAMPGCKVFAKTKPQKVPDYAWDGHL